MGWDYRDELWNGRREATTIFTLACPGVDDSCFCTAVGLGARRHARRRRPAHARSRAATSWRRRPRRAAPSSRPTRPASRPLAAATRPAARRRPRTTAPPRAPRSPPTSRSTPRPCATGSTRHFDDPLLAALGVRCHGCGACASVCPTCHCFDIVDEAEGVRPRHAPPQLGHLPGFAPSRCTPRATTRATDQHARFRQRIMHKFSDLPAAVRRGALHRLRPLHARLPRRPGPRRDPRRHRRGGTATAEACPATRSAESRGAPMTPSTSRTCATVTEVVDETRRHAHAAPRVPRRGGARGLRLPRRPVRRVLGLRRRRVAPSASPARPPASGYIECSFKAVGKVTRRCARSNVGDTIGFRGPYGNCVPDRRLEGQEPASSSPAASAWRRCAASSGTCSTSATSSATSPSSTARAAVGDLVYKRELTEWAARSDVRW